MDDLARWEHWGDLRARENHVTVGFLTIITDAPFTRRVLPMPKSVKSNAVPEMLKWCRVKSGISVEDIAKMEGLTPATINQWEAGHGTPTLARLRSLAKRYKRPTMVFYLQQPPREFSIVRDRRTLRNGRSLLDSPALRFAIRFAQERQAWAAQYLEESGAMPVGLIGSINRRDGVVAAGEKLRDMLRLSSGELQECHSEQKSLALLRRKLEGAGVLAFQAKSVSIEEMRGFALPNAFAPAVVVNSSDAPSAKILTLMHEVVHLALGESALTGSGPFGSEIAVDARGMEKFCNRVAAEVLMPASEFEKQIQHTSDLTSPQSLANLARAFHVSRAAVAMRLVELGHAEPDYLRDVLPMLMAPKMKDKKREIEIPGFRLAIGRNGEYFSRLAITAFRSGEIHGGELSGLLAMKLNHLPKLERQVFSQTPI